MIGRQTVVALVTARAGAKGMRGKNHRVVAGRSLLERAIACGREAETVDRVVLSSDDATAIAAALTLGCDVPFVRPEALARDTVSSIDVVRHALTVLEKPYDFVVLLQSKSPLRIAADVDGAVRQCARTGAPACASVAPCKKKSRWALGRGDRLSPNGAVYVARTKWLAAGNDFLSADTVAYAMPKDRSVDVDDETDLIVAEALAARLEPARSGDVSAPAVQGSFTIGA